ncbi:ImmA/IrrE family metallo-endopeptidase [Arthrobacter castelli]|uniref:ImmA/IrrE family metallo-endopeptidase n=1 Tax=Arthrobacter castelli TaxID=271431 RepID=UPI0004079F77|nr:ImmA/IrrE family metallo-endopeptidase [Arthrobacter castelli]
MTTATVPVSPDVLRWAQARSGRDDSYFAGHFDDWFQWLEGISAPTINEVEKLADATHVPFGVFFMDEAPDVRLPIADFRSGRSNDAAMPSQDLLDVLYQSQRRQAWYRDFAVRDGEEERTFVGSATVSADSRQVAAEIRRQLGFSVQDRQRLRIMSEVRKHLIRAAEELGILVVATSMVANNTHRMLDPHEFRGFSLADVIAPFIFINSADTKNGQIFTFIHEFAHLWLGQSGVDDQGPENLTDDAVERWCNSVAAEVLVPIDSLPSSADEHELIDTLEELAQRYRCSTLVILLRLRSAGLVAADGFSDIYEHELARVNALAHASEDQARSGGTFYANQPLRVGETLSKAIIQDGLEGGTPLPDAIRLLGFKHLEQFDRYAEELGIA